MSFSGELDGRLVVDGTVRSQGVRVWLGDSVLSLSEPGYSRLSISFAPFSVSMILTQQRKCMEQGLYFDFKGHDLGGISEGPLGHPGDGEYNVRTIVAFRTDTTYFPDRVQVDIQGRTASGTDVFDAGKVLPAVTFSAHFAIPKARFAEVFALKEHVHAYLMKVFDQVFA